VAVGRVVEHEYFRDSFTSCYEPRASQSVGASH
jgi:hypothetical protein